MAVSKSPFYVVQDFLSPKQCESIVDDLGYYSADVDKEGIPIAMHRHHAASETLVYDKFKPLIPVLEQYYEFEHRGTEAISFDFISAGVVPEAICDNSKWVNKKWTRTKDRDFSVVLFLSDYRDEMPFDSEYEVYGGKLEFLQHQFGFNPSRGTLVVYPSSPHFINAIADVVVGDLYMAKFHLAATMPYIYFTENFPGNYTSWFSDL